MSIDTANHIINDQEETIASLKDKLLAMEDERDIALHQALELVRAMKRIECAVKEFQDSKEDLDAIASIARKAIDDFQAK